MELAADWLKRPEQTHLVCMCVWKHARSCAEWHVMEEVWSEGGFAQRYGVKKKKQKSWFSKLTAVSLLELGTFCFDDVMFSSGGSRPGV